MIPAPRAGCNSDELAIGEVRPARYFSRELAIWRGEDGKARVLDAYCRHFGAHMGYGGRVTGNDLECQFHAWTYDGTGAVTSIPYAKTIPPQAKRANCVQSWPVVERNGFVWIWYHPEGAPPKWELDTYPEVGAPGWTPMRKFEWRVYNTIRNLFDNTLTVQFNHRMVAYTLWVVAILHLIDAIRVRAGSAAVNGALWLAVAMTVQATLGILTLLHQVPISLGLAHQGVAIVVLTLAIVQAERFSSRSPQAIAPAAVAVGASR